MIRELIVVNKDLLKLLKKILIIENTNISEK